MYPATDVAVIATTIAMANRSANPKVSTVSTRDQTDRGSSLAPVPSPGDVSARAQVRGTTEASR